MLLEVQCLDLVLQRSRAARPRRGSRRARRARRAGRSRPRRSGAAAPCAATSAPTLPTIGRVGRQPERRVHAGRLDVRDALDVDAFVHRHDLRRRDAVGAQDARDRVGGGDEESAPAGTSTCENEFVLRWKSTRREATSGGTGCAVDIDSASAAVETACGSCAWTMSGRSRLNEPRSFQPAFRSSSWLGRERDEVEAFRRAPAQLAGGVGDEHGAVAGGAQAHDRQQHLVLPAAPGGRRVDVNREHARQAGPVGARPRARARSSFTYLSST